MAEPSLKQRLYKISLGKIYVTDFILEEIVEREGWEKESEERRREKQRGHDRGR